MKLILLRHGESQWNLENRFTGWKDVELTKNGTEEAKFAGQQLVSKNLTNTTQEKLNLNKVDDDYTDLSAEVEDIISALVNLGYSRSEVFSVVMKIKNDTSPNNISKNFTVSQIVPIALKELSGGIE